MAARKDVFSNPVTALLIAFVTAIRNGDNLQGHPTVRLQQTATTTKVFAEVLVTHRFEHLNGDDAIENARYITIIADQNFNLVFQSGRSNSFASQPTLFVRQGNGGDAAAGGLRRPDGKAAPT